MRRLIWVLTGAVLVAMPIVSAAVSVREPPLTLAQNAQATASPMVNGEVRKVDKGAGKVTLKHDAIPNLDMPGMTMVFQVKDPAMLDRLKEGDKIKFAADKINGALTVTEVQANK